MLVASPSRRFRVVVMYTPLTQPVTQPATQLATQPARTGATPPMHIRRHPVAKIEHGDMLARVPVDAALIGRLRASYEQVRASDHRFAELFYAKLFAIAPHLRPLFTSNPAAQAAKLTASLDAIVANLEAPEANAEALAQLGRRHVGYGAKPEHYPVVVELLVESMAELLSTPTTSPAMEEWRTALRLVSERMIAAQESVDPTPPRPT